MLVLGRVVPDVRNFLVEITLHAAAERRIKLSQIGDLHYIFVIPSEVEESKIILRSQRHLTIRDASTPLSMTEEWRQWYTAESRLRF